MSSQRVSEDVIRDHLLDIREMLGRDGHVDEETLRQVAVLADDLSRDALKLRWERARRKRQ